MRPMHSAAPSSEHHDLEAAGLRVTAQRLAALEALRVGRVHLTADQVAACTRVSQVETIRIKPRVVVAA